MSDVIRRVAAFRHITPIRSSRPSASFRSFFFIVIGVVFTQNPYLKGAECWVRVVPKSSVLPRGDTAIITCATTITTDPIVWSRVTPPSKSEEVIYSYGRKRMNSGIRFSINRAEAGRFVLTITDVIVEDAGEYICRDNHGNGNESYAELSVFYGEPQASEASSPPMLCQTFHYRGKADLCGRWIVINVENVESILDPTTENRNTSDDHNQQVTSCFNSTSYWNADIKFEVYEVGGNWTSSRYLVQGRLADRSEATTVNVETTMGDGGNTTTYATAAGSWHYLLVAGCGVVLLLVVVTVVVLLVRLYVLKRKSQCDNWKLKAQRSSDEHRRIEYKEKCAPLQYLCLSSSSDSESSENSASSTTTTTSVSSKGSTTPLLEREPTGV